ncbi:mitochondrial ribosomal protein L48 isoform X1 [Megalopta genalis]|uniref:mitochondrial ribosomal protein L48 isoform X1 n=2 Tax=Megalopta genalis TaxID=115081 RepID=UPI003FD218DE
MALNIFKQVSMCYRHRLMNKAVRFYGIYEPPYIMVKHSGPPLYPVLNVQIRGYVYPLLESYQSFIDKLATELDVDINDSFAFPHRDFKIEKYKKQSSIVESEYNLKLFERDIIISNLTSTKLPIFIRILEAALPIGVSLEIMPYDPVLEEKRMIPDKELFDLKTELNEIKKSK